MNRVRSTNGIVRPRFGASLVWAKIVPSWSRIRMTAWVEPAWTSRFGRTFTGWPEFESTSMESLSRRSSAAAASWLRKSERMRLDVAWKTTIAKPHRITKVRPAEIRASRERIDRRSSTEHVPRSADGVQQPRLASALEFAAQVGHEDLDRVRRGERVVAPDLLEQAL